MRLNLKGMIFAGMLFFGVASLGGRKNPRFRSCRIRFCTPGETAKFEVTVANGTKARVKGDLQVKVLWEMEDFETVKEETVTLAPGEKRTITAEWRTSDVLGCEVRAELRDGQSLIARGRSISTSARPKTHSGWASTPGIRGSSLGPGRIISTRFHRW